jgi:hypothetical protein
MLRVSMVSIKIRSTQTGFFLFTILFPSFEISERAL